MPLSGVQFFTCSNRILPVISQRHLSLTGLIQPGNNKGLTIIDYLRNFNAGKYGFSIVMDIALPICGEVVNIKLLPMEGCFGSTE
jgi:hypothetical protein